VHRFVAAGVVINTKPYFKAELFRHLSIAASENMVVVQASCSAAYITLFFFLYD
jgi:hypothetical protein